MLSNDHVDTILFDLGGVIINLDYQATIDAFEALGWPDFTEQFSKATQSRFFEDFETGRKSPKALVEYIQKRLPQASEKQIIDAWNAMLLDVPARRIELLKNLRETHTLYLLSNNNDIHYDHFSADLKKDYGIENLGDLFDGMFLSQRIGFRKPDEEAFLHVMEETGLIPSQTLFLEDSPQHVATAIDLGFQTHLVQPGEDIAELFSGKLPGQG